MSEKELDVLEDADAAETPEISEDEDLLEFKASMGDPSEVPDPSTKKTDEKPKGKGDAMQKVKVPGTKAGMINAMYQEMSKMKKADLQAMYKGMNGVKEETEIEEEEIESRPLAKITTNDLNIQEDIDALFNGTDLSEEAQERITTVFESAVVSKVNEIVEQFAVDSESDMEVAREQMVNELTEKVDSYLDYVIQEWVEENKLAIEKGVRADMVEDFLCGLKGLFEEHYVDLPEEKVDVVEELLGKVEELEGKLNSQIDENVELTAAVKEFSKEMVFAESTEDLTDTQVEKLRGLAEGIDFVDAENFTKKLGMLKSQYFDIEQVTESVIVDDEKDPVALDEEEKQGPTGAMAAYTSAISRSIKK